MKPVAVYRGFSRTKVTKNVSVFQVAVYLIICRPCSIISSFPVSQFRAFCVYSIISFYLLMKFEIDFGSQWFLLPYGRPAINSTMKSKNFFFWMLTLLSFLKSIYHFKWYWLHFITLPLNAQLMYVTGCTYWVMRFPSGFCMMQLRKPVTLNRSGSGSTSVGFQHAKAM